MFAACTDESNFANYYGYNLNWVGPTGGLMAFLQADNWYAVDPSAIVAGTICSVNGYEHAILGIANGLCAAHNNARWAGELTVADSC